MEKTFEVKEIIKIPDGKHEAEIVDVQVNEHGEYEYVDFFFKILDIKDQPTMKLGVPSNLSTMTKFGLLLMNAGYDMASSRTHDFEKIKNFMIGQKATFKTIEKPKDVNGTKMEFSEIVYDTISF